MRSLAGTNLETNQSGVGVTGRPYSPIWKIVLSRSGQDTKTYTKTRVRSITHPESDDSMSAIVLLDNSDNALTAINFEMYRGDISYGFNDPANGDEYSTCAPLYVLSQRFFSAQGVLVCQLVLIGIPNLMAMDKAESELTLEDGDARTVKDLITAIARKTLAPYTNYIDYTVTYDSEDSIINSLKPRSAFQISENDNRWEKISQLLGWTGNKMRAENDAALHTFNPTTTGSSYDYEYELAVSGEHTFFNKELRNRFVNPNKVVVKSFEADEPQFSGSATSATSYALFPKTRTLRFRLVSDTEASNIATARIETHELDADVGAVSVPMNVGQEVWDYIKVTDSRQGDSRVGNVRQITRRVQVPQRGGQFVFSMDIRFGKTVGLAPITIGQEANLALSVQALVEAYNGMREDMLGILEKLNEIIAHLNSLHEFFYSKHIHATDIMRIPVEE